MAGKDRGGRRESILAAASSIADTDGLDAVTVRATADRAGVGVGTLRHYFPTQKELFDAIVARRVDTVIDDSVVLDTSATLDARISSMITQFLPDDLDDVAALRLWFTSYSSALGPNPAESNQRLLAAAAARSHEHMRRWLRHFVDESLLDADSVDDAANTAIALTVGIAMEALTPGSPTTVPEGRRLLARHFAGVLGSNRA
jgi:AcrR family transcriptional regulator